MYVIPPMDDEPPRDFVAFVTTHVGALRRETDRLVDGDFEAGHIYLDVLADLAGHWRRLRFLTRWHDRSATESYLTRRLLARTREWREEQTNDIEVRVLRPQDLYPTWSERSSLALRKAGLLPTTRRSNTPLAIADAGIAWVHAYRKQQWRRAGRLAVTMILLIGALIQLMSLLSTPT